MRADEGADGVDMNVDTKNSWNCTLKFHRVKVLHCVHVTL